MASAKKVTKTEETASVKKPVTRKKVVFTLQTAGKDLTINDMEEKAVAAWMEQTGNAKKEAKEIQLYVKPEDGMIYYVINGITGSAAL